MIVSGENLADWFPELLVICQYEQGLGNPHSEEALRLRQRFTERAAERADVNSIGGSVQAAAGEDAASQIAYRLGGDRIAFGQAELEHPSDVLWLFLPSAEQ
jgi:hypothetical protein